MSHLFQVVQRDLYSFCERPFTEPVHDFPVFLSKQLNLSEIPQYLFYEEPFKDIDFKNIDFVGLLFLEVAVNKSFLHPKNVASHIITSG